MYKIIIVILFLTVYNAQAQFTGGNGRGYATGVRTSGSLPIELIYFSGKCDGGKNLLQWATASETNNNYFTIENSFDGINWKIIAYVSGAGNSTTKIDYNFTDENVNKTDNYYRLKQTDYDGKYEYSKIININKCDKEEPELSIYPNPNNGILNLSFNGDLASFQSIEIVDVLGQIVFFTSSPENSLNLMNLSNGTYLVKFTNKSEVITQKIILSR